MVRWELGTTEGPQAHPACHLRLGRKTLCLGDRTPCACVVQLVGTGGVYVTHPAPKVTLPHLADVLLPVW